MIRQIFDDIVMEQQQQQQQLPIIIAADPPIVHTLNEKEEAINQPHVCHIYFFEFPSSANV